MKQQTMKVFLALSVVFLGITGVATDTHSLWYFYTASSGMPGFPEFVTVGMVDGQPISYYDSVIKKEIPKQDWMAKTEGPEYWERQTQISIGTEQTFKGNIEIVKQRFNQTGELPSVSLLQKTSSSPVTCHATGFYPDRADLVWMKDGVELHEDVDKGEILPNHDGTFQMSVDLKMSSIKAEDWKKYDCVFQLSGVEDKITKLDKAVIRTNEVPGSSGFPVAAVLGCVEGLCLLAACIAAFVIWRRKYGGFSRTNTSDTSSSSAEDPDPKKKTSDDQKIMIKTNK